MNPAEKLFVTKPSFRLNSEIRNLAILIDYWPQILINQEVQSVVDFYSPNE